MFSFARITTTHGRYNAMFAFLTMAVLHVLARFFRFQCIERISIGLCHVGGVFHRTPQTHAVLGCQSCSHKSSAQSNRYGDQSQR